LKRVVAKSPDLSQVLDEAISRCRAVLGHGEILRLMGGIFPAEQLGRVTFAEILRFRQETAPQRRSFLEEICETIRVLEGDPSRSSYDREVALAVRDLRKRMHSVQVELSSTRDKLLPSMTDGMLYGAAGTGALGSLGTFLGGLSTRRFGGGICINSGRRTHFESGPMVGRTPSSHEKADGGCFIPFGNGPPRKVSAGARRF
jgi:hypothetical protein